MITRLITGDYTDFSIIRIVILIKQENKMHFSLFYFIEKNVRNLKKIRNFIQNRHHYILLAR